MSSPGLRGSVPPSIAHAKTLSAFDEVQQMSDSAFTSAVELT